jgi:hypothetical protein
MHDLTIAGTTVRNTPRQPCALTEGLAQRSAEPVLKPEASAELRDGLVAELNGLASAEEAALCVDRS